MVGNSTIVTPDKPEVAELEKAFVAELEKQQKALEIAENIEKEKIRTQGLSATELNQIVQEDDDDEDENRYQKNVISVSGIKKKISSNRTM